MHAFLTKKFHLNRFQEFRFSFLSTFSGESRHCGVVEHKGRPFNFSFKPSKERNSWQARRASSDVTCSMCPPPNDVFVLREISLFLSGVLCRKFPTGTGHLRLSRYLFSCVIPSTSVLAFCTAPHARRVLSFFWGTNVHLPFHPPSFALRIIARIGNERDDYGRL